MNRVFPHTMQIYQFEKAPIPDDPEDKAQFVESLMEFGISVQQYEKAYGMDDITMYVGTYGIHTVSYTVLCTLLTRALL